MLRSPTVCCSCADPYTQYQVGKKHFYDTLKTLSAGATPKTAGKFLIPALRTKVFALFTTSL